MQIMYTSGKCKEPIYLTDEQYEKVKDLKIYNHRNRLVCYGDTIQAGLGAILYPELFRVTRIDKTIQDYRPSNINLDAKKEHKIVGINKAVSRGVSYFACSVCTEGKQIAVPGYYKSKEDAVIAREHFIIKNGLDYKRSDLGLSDQEIFDRYEEIVIKKQREETEIRRTNKHEKALQNNTEYGIRKRLLACGDISYLGIVQDRYVGSNVDIKVVKCMRNLYIIDNNIKGDKIYDVGMTIDEQRKYVSDNKQLYTLGIKQGRKYRGLTKNTSSSTVTYAVQVRNGQKVEFVGSSKDQRLAAMMYNIYKVKMGKAKESINDVGLTIEEQIETLDHSGYYMTEDFKFKRKR